MFVYFANILHTHVSLIIGVFKKVQDNKTQLMDFKIQYII